MSRPLAGTDVIILAGGQGSRIRAVLPDTPKLLAPVAGQPFLDLLLRALAKLGANKVVLSLGHLAAQVTDHLSRTLPPLPVGAVIESRPLGTAGAIAFARPAVASDPVMVLNGDTWLDFDAGAMLSTHRAGPAVMVTIACVAVSNASRYGRLEIGDDAEVLRFAEKEEGTARPGLVNAGVYFFSAGFMDTLARGCGPSLERDVLPHLPPRAIRAYVADSRSFIDIGTPDSYAAAQSLFAVPALGAGTS